jgi:serine protease Do
MSGLTSLRASRSIRRLSVALVAAVWLLQPARWGVAEEPGKAVERETPIVRAVRRVQSSVVNIHGQKMVRNTAAAFAGASNETVRQVNGMGTGIVIDPRGYLLTNFHVVEEVSDIRVTLADNRTTSADVIASDSRYDLAVLKINIDDSLPVVPLGTSADLMVGERVIAIGNAYGYENTVTDGIISALHRNVPVNETQDYADLIQTSAGINPGNSGGPLLNILGEVIGINVAVRVGANSIAFAIPIDAAIEVARDIIRRYNEQRLSIGLATARDLRAGTGVLVSKLDDGSPALAGGLKPGDRILKVGDRDVKHALDFELALLELKPGERVAMDVQRGARRTALEVELSEPAAGQGALQLASRVWSLLGVRGEPLSGSETRQMNLQMRERQNATRPYQGGLRVLSVRPNSPAAAFLRPGDILVGLHKYQTTSLADLDAILRQPEIQRMRQTKFYIVRHWQTLEGDLPLARRQASRRSYR